LRADERMACQGQHLDRWSGEAAHYDRLQTYGIGPPQPFSRSQTELELRTVAMFQ